MQNNVNYAIKASKSAQMLVIKIAISARQPMSSLQITAIEGTTASNDSDQSRQESRTGSWAGVHGHPDTSGELSTRGREGIADNAKGHREPVECTSFYMNIYK